MLLGYIVPESFKDLEEDDFKDLDGAAGGLRSMGLETDGENPFYWCSGFGENMYSEVAALLGYGMPDCTLNPKVYCARRGTCGREFSEKGFFCTVCALDFDAHVLTSKESILMRLFRGLAVRSIISPVRRAFWALCPPEYRGSLRVAAAPDGTRSFAGGADPYESAWPLTLARPVSTSGHAFFAIEEDAFALKLARNLASRRTRVATSVTQGKHRRRRAMRRQDLR